jgi:tRNA uridine 5-carbamoylmethylation protein Kti12
MNKFIILSGIPGSGKSTLIAQILKEELNKPFIICKDSIRFSILDSEHTKIYFNSNIEDLVYQISNELIELAILNNRSIIIDETNESAEIRIKYYEKVMGKEYKIIIHQFSNFQKAKKMNRERNRIVPNSVMERKIRNYESFSLFEKAISFNQFFEIDYINHF